MTSSTTPATESDLDGRLGNGVRDAVDRTMTQICEKAPNIERDGATLEGEGVSAAIAYAGDVPFTLVLAVPRATAGPLMRTFTGVPIDFDADVMEDVAGELLNVIAGEVVAQLGVHGIVARMGLPVVKRSLDILGFVDGGRNVLDLTISGEAGQYRVAVLGEPMSS